MNEEDIVLAEKKIRNEYRKKINSITATLDDLADTIQYKFGFCGVYYDLIRYIKKIREENEKS